MTGPPRYVDLTLPVRDGMMRYPSPNHPDVRVTSLGTLAGAGRATSRIELGSHSGTHVDAPSHFLRGSASVDELPLDVLIGPALVVDLTGRADTREIDAATLAAMVGSHRPTRLILRTDWWRHWEQADYYTAAPFLAADAAEFLIGLGVKLLAMDFPSPDAPPVTDGIDSPNHKRFMESGVILVEYLSNTSEIQRAQVELVVLPLRIEGADGAPARCVAIER